MRGLHAHSKGMYQEPSTCTNLVSTELQATIDFAPLTLVDGVEDLGEEARSDAHTNATLGLVGEAFVYEVKTDATHCIIDFFLSGLVRDAEIDQFIAELQEATKVFAGREIKIKADLRAFSPASPEVASKIKAVQEFGIQNGVKRVAEIVESDVVALQLNRVARESGTDKILRRFWEDESALDWLIHGDR